MNCWLRAWDVRGLDRCYALDWYYFFLAGYLFHQALAGQGRGRVHVDRMGVHGQIALDVGQLLTALRALLHVSRDGPGFVFAQQLHGKQSQIFRFDMSGQVHDWKAFLNVVRALRILVFTVPSGSPVISAISEWVRPS